MLAVLLKQGHSLDLAHLFPLLEPVLSKGPLGALSWTSLDKLHALSSWPHLELSPMKGEIRAEPNLSCIFMREG